MLDDSDKEKLDLILNKLDQITKHLDIVPDSFVRIHDIKTSVNDYSEFAKNELNLTDNTIQNHKSQIKSFLEYFDGAININTVREYLDSNDSQSWKSNQVKAFRRYIRDYLKLGNWINEFDFGNVSVKIKEIPNDSNILIFFNSLPNNHRLVFLVLLTTGLRIGEVCKLKVSNFNLDTLMINVSNFHSGLTKSSWITYTTRQTGNFLIQHIKHNGLEQDDYLFDLSTSAIQKIFKKTSNDTSIRINPHLLRSVFTEKCTIARIHEKYIDAFCGRVQEQVIRKYYSDYSPEKLRLEYSKVESLLTLGNH